MPRRPERELLARLTHLAHPSAGQWALAHRMQAAGHDVVPLRPVLTRRDQALALDNNDRNILLRTATVLSFERLNWTISAMCLCAADACCF